MRIRNYELITAPQPVFLAEWKLREAYAFFEWFVENRSARLQQLRRVLDDNDGINIALDFQVSSLPKLGTWFNSHVQILPCTREEIQQQIVNLPEMLKRDFHDFISNWQFSEETASLCYDIGIYLGETMRAQFPDLQWKLCLDQGFIDFQQPCLGPFPNKLLMNPVSILHTVASGVVSGKDAAKRLPQIYDVWTRYLHTSG